MLWKKAGQSVSAVDHASQMQMSVGFFSDGFIWLNESIVSAPAKYLK